MHVRGQRCSRSKRCRSCKNDRDRQRAAQLDKLHERMTWARAVLGNRCAIQDCENTDLEFDHLDPSEKEANIPRIWSRSFAFFEAEVRKCQLLCHEHHVAKHYGPDVDASFDPEILAA